MNEQSSEPVEDQRIDKLVGALVEAQAKITSPPRNREVTVKMRAGGTYKFKYATLDSIIEHVRQALTSNGLWFTQTLEDGGDGKHRLITALVHKSGQQIRSVTPILVQETGNQAFGSALSYMRRYALCSILGIAADEDDDANAADGNEARQRAAPPPRPQRQPRVSQPAAPTTERAAQIADNEGVSPSEATRLAEEEEPFGLVEKLEAPINPKTGLPDWDAFGHLIVPSISSTTDMDAWKELNMPVINEWAATRSNRKTALDKIGEHINARTEQLLEIERAKDAEEVA